MTVIAAKRGPLFRQALREVWADLPQQWYWILVIAIFLTVFVQCSNTSLTVTTSGLKDYTTQAKRVATQIQQQIAIQKQHPEQSDEVAKSIQLLKQKMPPKPPIAPVFFVLGLYFTGLFFAMSGPYYLFALAYLQKHLPDKASKASAGHYFYWLRKILWKYIRPFLWLLIPFIGPILWLRSVLRSSVVSPLALMRDGDELPHSWILTKDKVWRLLGNAILFGICISLIVWIPLGLLLGIAIFALGGKTVPYMIFSSFLTALSMAFSTYYSPIFYWVAYRVLQEEYNAAAVPAPLA